MDKPAALHAVNAHQVLEQYILLFFFCRNANHFKLGLLSAPSPIYKCAHMNWLFIPMLSVLRYFAGVACS